MNNIRYCRICWNTQGWQHPTGEAAKLEGTSSVSEHGFGHEEWLFNYGWLIDGHKHGFLQPLQYLNLKSRSNIFDIILYTVAPTRKRFFVGRITNCELSTSEEAAKVHKAYVQKGWLDEMVEDLLRLNIDPEPITSPAINPVSIANFRFKPENVEMLWPYIPVETSHKINRVSRYRPLIGTEPNEWAKIVGGKNNHSDTEISFRSRRLKSTELRNRAAQKGVLFDPAHDRLQNALFKKLVDLYGKDNVGYEDNAVDIVARHESEIIFYEIKTATSAKHCIRLALGQLLEYSHWPNFKRAQKLIIVGPVSPSQDAKQYMEYLRSQYSLPIYYRYYDLSNDVLSREY